MNAQLQIKFQRLAAKVWPLTLLVAVIFTPFLVRKSYQELKRNDK